MKDFMNFSKNLKGLRKKYGIKQKDLSESTGISRSVLSYYEAEKSEPTLSAVIKIAEALNMSIDDLVSGDLTNKDFIEEEIKVLEKVKDNNTKLYDETVLNDLNKLRDSYLKELERFNKLINNKIKQIDKVIEFMKKQE